MKEPKPPQSAVSEQTFSVREIVSAVDHFKALQRSDTLKSVSDFIRKTDVKDLLARGVQVQNLVDNGLSTGASTLAEFVHKHDTNGKISEAIRARAWKELAMKASEAGVSGAGEAIANAMEAYRRQYDSDPESRVRSSLNLIGLATLARQFDVPVPVDIDRIKLATIVLEDLHRTPQGLRGARFYASKAEAFIALNDLDRAQSELARIVQNKTTSAETLGAVTRQLRDLWQLGTQSNQGAGIIQTMGAAVLTRNFDVALLPAGDVKALAEATAPSDRQLESILGKDGPLSYEWVKRGMESAQSVGVVRIKGVNTRVGTGFIVRGGDVVPALGDEICVLTNAHVVSDNPSDKACFPEEVEIVFEAADKNISFGFSKLHKSWPKEHLDASLLSIDGMIPAVKPLSFAPRLPLRDGTQRVYVIGYPNGGELAFSLQHNHLIDHEGPHEGTPVDNSVRHVQYTAPTEPGSSGSPVFNARNWQVIALHQKGDRDEGLRRLNGRTDKWAANQGIWIQSICTAGAI
ncbi:serine protease [Rhizobium leguminosarum]|uniref:S1 family peptidase n=1 Tax=Rhizobium leguminosarum TaxID=384 RepID=UPI003F9A1635